MLYALTNSIAKFSRISRLMLSRRAFARKGYSIENWLAAREISRVLPAWPVEVSIDLNKTTLGTEGKPYTCLVEKDTQNSLEDPGQG